MNMDWAIATGSFKGEYITGEEYKFTKGKKYSCCRKSTDVFIMDDTMKGVKFSIEDALSNFIFQ